MRSWSRITALTLLAAASLACSVTGAWAQATGDTPSKTNSAQSAVVAGSPLSTDVSLRYGKTVLDRLPLSAAVSMWWIRTFPTVRTTRTATSTRAASRPTWR
jgi:hypothetical protein